jgi:hypothetical protein
MKCDVCRENLNAQKAYCCPDCRSDALIFSSMYGGYMVVLKADCRPDCSVNFCVTCFETKVSRGRVCQ